MNGTQPVNERTTYERSTQNFMKNGKHCKSWGEISVRGKGCNTLGVKLAYCTCICKSNHSWARAYEIAFTYTCCFMWCLIYIYVYAICSCVIIASVVVWSHKPLRTVQDKKWSRVYIHDLAQINWYVLICLMMSFSWY